MAVALCAASAAYGHLRLAQVRTVPAHPDTPRISVGLVQPNLPVSRRERSAWEQRAGGLETLTLALARMEPKPDLIIWPEIPPPVSYWGNAEDRVRIDRLLLRRRLSRRHRTVR